MLAPTPSSRCIHTWLSGWAVGDGERVKVSTRRGEVWLRTRISDAIRSDTVFVPFHWAGKQRANTLTDPQLDPVSKMPPIKVCAARIYRLSAGAPRVTAP